MVAPSKGHPGNSWSEGTFQVKHKDLLLRTHPLGDLSLNDPFTQPLFSMFCLCTGGGGNTPKENVRNG